MTTGELVLRRAEPGELDRVVETCGAALAWADPETDAEFFRWKHRDNAFGPSEIWVATEDPVGVEDPSIVGVRAMMTWRLTDPDGRGHELRRAVDTATLPSHQGRGIFRSLTTRAVDELTEAGVAAIFNTPNDKSRPGYLKMGWESLGRVPVVVRPRSPRSLAAMARSKVPAEKWGIATEVGDAPETALADVEAVEAALDRSRPDDGRWTTEPSVAFLRWRTGFEPLRCRIHALGASAADGFIVFRLRRRGELIQLSILDVVGAGASDGALRRAIGDLLGTTGADVALASGRALGWRCGMIPLPNAGPLLTWRPLARPGSPTLDRLDLPLSAIELF